MSEEWQNNKISRLQGRPVDVNGSEPNAVMKSQMYSVNGGYLPASEWSPTKAEELDSEAVNYSNDAYLKPLMLPSHKF